MKKWNKAKHWFEWGCEPLGFVTTGYYNKLGRWISTGIMPKNEAEYRKLTHHCPYA